MNNNIAEDVYYSLLGQLIPEYAVPWVDDAFAMDSSCDQQYNRIHAAYTRLRERLEEEDEDADVEILIDAFLSIQEELCLKMFQYGVEYAKKHCRD